MTVLWKGEGEEPDQTPLGPAAILRVLVRFVFLAPLVYGCLVVFWLVRLIEWPFGGRPVSPFITQFVCRNALRVLGIGYRVYGRPMQHRGAVVANHSSWLDIFTLNAPQRIFFVSKAEVSSWPGIGVLARSTGTVFIERRPSHAARQKVIFHDRLSNGDKLLFFPEGTSSDSTRVLPFKSTLFAAFFDGDLPEILWVQPVTARYIAPAGEDPRFYGWWGEMAFVPNLIKMLAAKRTGRVEILFHDPVRVRDFASRKALATYCEATVRSGLAGVPRTEIDQS